MLKIINNMVESETNFIEIQQVFTDDLSDNLWETIAKLIRESFAEHAEKGLNMMPCNISKNQLMARRKNSMFFLAYVQKKLVGCILFRVTGKEGVSLCGYISITAVHPLFRRLGIGQKLHYVLEIYAKSNNMNFLSLDTSCKALTSRKHHAKNGYKSWYYAQFPTANYHSIVMRKDINEKYVEWRRWLRLIISWFYINLNYTSHGTPSWLHQKLYFFKHSYPIHFKRFVNKLTLREIQEITFKLLEYFDEFCVKHNLKYFLCYGSLIGAVRHKGFIPWDDDIDVTMPLPDYEKMLYLIQNKTTEQHIQLIYGMKHGAGTPFAMLTDTRTVAYTPGRDITHTHPIAIDIFPAYALSNNRSEAQQQIDDICSLVRKSHEYLKSPSPRHFISWIKYKITSRYKLNNILKKIRAIVYKYPWGSTNQIRIMSLDEHEYLAMKNDEFDHFIMQPFEGGKFRIPANYEDHLRELYGNYMELPLPEQRHGILSSAYSLR